MNEANYHIGPDKAVHILVERGTGIEVIVDSIPGLELRDRNFRVPGSKVRCARGTYKGLDIVFNYVPHMEITGLLGQYTVIVQSAINLIEEAMEVGIEIADYLARDLANSPTLHNDAA
jgi:hypothetical protein